MAVGALTRTDQGLSMNAPLLPDHLIQPYGEVIEEAIEPSLDLATAGVQRWVWRSRFGPMLIEVRNGGIYVNGGRVEPAPGHGGAGSMSGRPRPAPALGQGQSS